MISLTRISRFFRHAGRQIWFRAAVISATSVVIAALAGIVARLDPELCRGCRARIFAECAGRPAPP